MRDSFFNLPHNNNDYTVPWLAIRYMYYYILETLYFCINDPYHYPVFQNYPYYYPVLLCYLYH